MRDKDLGNFSAGSMRQREHLDEATVACWVTFCAAAIRLLILFAAGQASGISQTIVWTCGAGRGARSRRRGRPPADGVILVMRYPGHSPSCPTRLAHTDRDRHPIRMQSWPAPVEQPPRDDRGIEIGCWRWAVGEPMPGFRLVPAACDHLVAQIGRLASG